MEITLKNSNEFSRLETALKKTEDIDKKLDKMRSARCTTENTDQILEFEE